MIDGIEMLKWLEHGNGLILIGGGLVLIGIILLVRSISSFAERFTKKQQPTIKRTLSTNVGRKMVQLLILLLITMTGVSVVMGGLSLKTYQVFTKEKLVGMVECTDWSPTKKEMLVRFTMVDKNTNDQEQYYTLYGDMWEINAHILKWQPKLNILGIHTGYRLNQIKGIYEEPKDVSDGRHVAYGLQGGKDWIWWALSKYNQKIPLVEAIYGNAVSRPARDGEKYEIYVTTSGLIARRLFMQVEKDQ